jgi:hypothetical protein
MDQLAHRRGQYRSAVASGERVGYVQQLIPKADPTLQRSGAERFRNLIPGCGPSCALESA